MSNRTTVFLLTIVIAAIALLFVLNTAGMYVKTAPDKFISPNDVRGMAVVHNGKQYTLSFEQQNKVVSILNRCVKIGLEGYLIGEDDAFDYEQLVIFRFNENDVKIKPVTFANQQLIFQAPEFNSKGLLRETGPGELNLLLTEAYDKE